jgi:hypothetical protein
VKWLLRIRCKLHIKRKAHWYGPYEKIKLLKFRLENAFIHALLLRNALIYPLPFTSGYFPLKTIISLVLRTTIPGTRIQISFSKYHNMMKITQE